MKGDQLLPSQELLQEYFYYSPVTGELFWRKHDSPYHQYLVGEVAGCRNGAGYLNVTFQYTQYLVHRLIWRYVTGEDPEILEIHHRNEIKHCNAWHNLDKLTSLDNIRESAPCPLPPYIYKTPYGRFGVRVRRKHYGVYTTLEEAVAKVKEVS